MAAHKIEQEAEAHIALGRLLRRDRPPELQQAVQKVLDSDLSTGSKVAKIRKLDGAVDQTDASSATGDEGAEADKNDVQLWQPLRFTLGRLKTIIKLPHSQTSLLSYLFLEHRKIKEFGRKTHVFRPTVVLPRLQLDAAIPQFLSTSLQTWANRLLELLAPVLENGWELLSKRDYNMIVAMRKLCDEISGVNFKILNYRDRYFIDKIRNIEAMFFVFQYRHEHVDDLLENVSRVLFADGEHNDEAEEIELLIKTILTQGFSIPSLYDLLLGLNMMKLRRAVTYTDLVASDLGDLFNSAHFACGPNVQEEIESSVETLRDSILKLEAEHRRLRRVREYLPVNESGEFDDNLLEGFYEFEESRFEGVYRRDKENVVEFVPQFLRKLDVAFGPLLVGKLHLAKAGQVSVFGPQAFMQPIDQIRRLGFKLEQSSFGYRIFSYSRYIGIRRDGKGAIPVEAEIVKFLQEAINNCRALANKVAGILERAAREAPLDEDHPGEEPVVSEVMSTLPHADEEILSSGYLHGRTVRASLEILVSLCFMVARYLYDKDIVDLHGSVEAVKNKVDSQLRNFERLADEGAFREVVARVLRPDEGGGEPLTEPPAYGDQEAPPE